MNSMAFRQLLVILMLALAGNASAVGLGDLRGSPSLGQGLKLEIDLIGATKAALDANCFRLVPPTAANELPWLRRAIFSVQQGKTPVLEIRSELPLREPVLQLVVELGCGHDISREYIVLASPAMDTAPVSRPLAQVVVEPMSSQVATRPPRSSRPQAIDRPKPAPRLSDPVPQPAPGRKAKAEKRPAESGLPDRVILPAGDDVGDPSLRLSTEFSSMSGKGVTEAQREVLRLEYGMLIALHDQATTQLAAAEKLRVMESTLGELQQRTSDFAQRIEQGAVPGGVSANRNAEPAVPPPSAKPTGQPKPLTRPATPVVPEESSLSEWSLYGGLLGALLGLVGWFGWKKYRERQATFVVLDDDLLEPEVEVDPKRGGEFEERGGVDLQVEPAAMGMPMIVDVDIGHLNEGGSAAKPAKAHDSMFSISSATVDEHFEANPVMELADIMLSFGRVKGAAQALQEYIDNNPQEALQPWIRLMEVYRMAGMREEFENIASSLNKNFNVEVQSWASGPEATEVDFALDEDSGSTIVQAPRPECLEDMPRIMNNVLEMWAGGDVIGYLYQLLRDNRDGKRQGFALPVVEEILFLIELKETANRLQ